MLEINLEIKQSFSKIQKAISLTLNFSEDKVLSDMDYWCLTDFIGYLGMSLEYSEGDFQTLITIWETPEKNYNIQELGLSLARLLDCKIAIPYANTEDEARSGKLAIFESNGRKFTGYGTDYDDGYFVSSLVEVEGFS